MSFFCSKSAGNRTFLHQNQTPKNTCYQAYIPTKIENLLNWQIGFLTPRVEINNGDFGLGVFAKESIESGKVLLSIQKEDLITIDMAFLVI